MQLPSLTKAHDASDHSAPRLPTGVLGGLVRMVDRLLRRWEGVFEFTADPDCVFRIAIVPSEMAAALSDGARLQVGDLIVDLHLWNENLPRIAEHGPDLAWSMTMRRRMHESFMLLARWLEAHPEHARVLAVRARTTFVSHDDSRAMERVLASYRFEPVPRVRRHGWLSRLHDLGENLLIWGLVRTFNPGGLRTKGFMRRRHEYWTSRERFLAQYGREGSAGDAQRDMAASGRGG